MCDDVIVTSMLLASLTIINNAFQSKTCNFPSASWKLVSLFFPHCRSCIPNNNKILSVSVCGTGGECKKPNSSNRGKF